MKIKSFIIILYTLAGLIISALSAFMTFIIIDEPIGMKMFTQIIFSILMVLPIVIFISYYFGNYLSHKFTFIKERLHQIEKENFTINNTTELLSEINEINKSMNIVSTRLDSLIHDLKQKNQNLSHMLISMAHDVKTPITILNGYVEEIEDGLIKKEKFPEVLHNMKNEIHFINELSNDMIDFISSMQNNRAQEKVHLYTLINELNPIVSNKDLEFINEIPKNFTLKFNKMDLKKICLNLLTNAYKYSNSGYVKIKTIDNTILFENTGKEIKQEYREKIFEPFFSISKSKNRSQSGFGLGLSIVKNLSNNNGYDCYVKDSTIKKTIFTLNPLS